VKRWWLDVVVGPVGCVCESAAGNALGFPETTLPLTDVAYASGPWKTPDTVWWGPLYSGFPVSAGNREAFQEVNGAHKREASFGSCVCTHLLPTAKGRGMCAARRRWLNNSALCTSRRDPLYQCCPLSRIPRIQCMHLESQLMRFPCVLGSGRLTASAD
jgi:hypothetical protein